MASYKDRLKEAYAKDVNFPDIWKIADLKGSDIFDRSAAIVKAMRSAVQAVKLNYLLIGKILFTAQCNCVRFIYLEDGSSYDLFVWAEREFKLKKSALYEAIQAYESYCVNSPDTALPVVKSEYEGFSHSQLVEMLPLEYSQRRDITPDMTVKEIRAYKQSLKESKEPKDESVTKPEVSSPVHIQETIVIEPEPETASGKCTTSVLKNLAERKAWLANYRAWGAWIRVPQLGMTYYRYDFGNGDAVIVDEVEVAKTSWNKEGINRHYHLLTKEGYRSEWNPGTIAQSEIFDYLCEKRPAVIVYAEQKEAIA